ncbi:MAG: nuclear mRNA export, poly(A)+RNA binding protein [Geoglossum umbratile]|nr:MAG: nuclear mRNA export, poly(A)+RNA binding protein [Geoglossum umbratile]
MLHQRASTPTGPKARVSTRNNNTLTTQIAHGGIRKRRSNTPRIDKDGDLDMDGPTDGAGGRGRGGRGRGGPSETPTRGNMQTGRGQPRGPPRGGFFGGAGVQQAILRGMARGDARVRNPGGGFGTTSGFNVAAGREKGWGGEYDEIRVRGLQESKAASNRDGGVSDLLAFLERKANGPDTKPGDAVRIRKSRPDGDSMIIYVKPEDTPKILRLNAFQFAQSRLTIERRHEQPTRDAATKAFGSDDVGSSPELKQVFTDLLNRRYGMEQKFLDLSSLNTDKALAGKQFFGNGSRGSNLFPALMSTADRLFTSSKEKREAVVSVSLSSNGLNNISMVSSFAQSFPDIKNLDLSNNNFADIRSLSGWRWKFRSLDQLILTGNPIEKLTPTYNTEILKWYPTLRMLNGVRVRSHQELATLAASRRLPIPILAPNFQDESQIGENFVKYFFPAYDMDRANLANSFYDTLSTFSFSVNTSAPRATIGEQQKSISWDAYIKGSRNLKKISHLGGRMSRFHTGTGAIRGVWSTLPATRHPDLLAMGSKWLIECHGLPGQLDMTGQSPTGVGGLIVIIHGEFDEIDISTGNKGTKRSFDRTFVLGPGAGVGGIRVVSDQLTLRAYGGCDAFELEYADAPVSPIATGTTPSQPYTTEGLGVAMGGKSDEQLRKELMVIEMSKRTGMTLEFSHICLEEKAWDFDSAGLAFEQVKANLPPNAWM